MEGVGGVVVVSGDDESAGRQRLMLFRVAQLGDGEGGGDGHDGGCDQGDRVDATE